MSGGSKTAHVLAADLRCQILAGSLQAGERLPPEAELTAALDVSRETLREALRVLEAQSLLHIRRGRGGGAVVRRPGLSSAVRYVALLLQLRGTTLAHLEEARAVLEPPVVERLAHRPDGGGPDHGGLAVGGLDHLIDHLVALHDNERAAARDPFGFATAMATFDRAVTELAGNRSIAVLSGILRVIHAGQVFLAIQTVDPAVAERVARRVADAHAPLLAGLRRHDGAAASVAWRDYLLGTGRLLARPDSQRPIDVVPLWRADPQPRAAAAVANEIRARIAEGRLAAGDRLPALAALAAEFGVSRPTLREALRVLEMESLLVVRPGDRAGPQVRHPSAQAAAQVAGTVLAARQVTLGEHLWAVEVLEPAMMALTATRVDRATLAELRRHAARLTTARQHPTDFTVAWRQATAAAFGATGNPALAVVAEILQWVRGAPRAAAAPRLTPVFAELVEALAAADPAAARARWVTVLDAERDGQDGR